MRTQNQNLAKSLRRRSTEVEKKLWHHLRNRQLAGHKFRRQQPYGNYILDFYCAAIRLAIELDGDPHGTPGHQQRDRERDQFLAAEGITVLRFWNFQVMQEFDAVLEVIWRELQRQPLTLTVAAESDPAPTPHPNPLPQGARESELGAPPRQERVNPKSGLLSPPRERIKVRGILS